MERRVTNLSSNEQGGNAAVHPKHDEIASQVSQWFTTSNSQIGYEVVPTWFGFLGTFGGTSARVILRIDDPHLVEPALIEATRARRRAVSVWVDDPARAKILDSALVAIGCTAGASTEHLALVGDVRVASECVDLTIKRASDEQRVEWAQIKLQCFANSEEPPDSGALKAELATRDPERPIAESWFAELSERRVGVLAFYTGLDRAAYLLGTRVPFRGRGVAQTMLAKWVRDGQLAGSRSHLINATVGGAPAALYRRLGFVDVVHWYQRYDLDLEPAPTVT